MKVNILSNCCQNDYCIIDFIQTLNILPLLNQGPIPLLSRYLNGNPSPPGPQKKSNPNWSPTQAVVQNGQEQENAQKTGSNTKPRAYLEFHRWGTVKSGCFDKQLSNSANSVKTVAWQLSLEKVPWSLSAMEGSARVPQNECWEKKYLGWTKGEISPCVFEHISLFVQKLPTEMRLREIFRRCQKIIKGW